VQTNLAANLWPLTFWVRKWHTDYSLPWGKVDTDFGFPMRFCFWVESLRFPSTVTHADATTASILPYGLCVGCVWCVLFLRSLRTVRCVAHAALIGRKLRFTLVGVSWWDDCPSVGWSGVVAEHISDAADLGSVSASRPTGISSVEQFQQQHSSNSACYTSSCAILRQQIF